MTPRLFAAGLVLAILFLSAPHNSIAQQPAVNPRAALLRAANATLNDLRRDPAARTARTMLQDAQAVLIVPRLVKGGLVFGAEGGSGVLLRHTENSWGNPRFYDLGTASFGLQAGLEQAGLVFFINSDRALRVIEKGEVRLGTGIPFVTLSGSGEGAARDIVVWTSGNGANAGMNFNGLVIRQAGGVSTELLSAPETVTLSRNLAALAAGPAAAPALPPGGPGPGPGPLPPPPPPPPPAAAVHPPFAAVHPPFAPAPPKMAAVHPPAAAVHPPVAAALPPPPPPPPPPAPAPPPVAAAAPPPVVVPPPVAAAPPPVAAAPPPVAAAPPAAAAAAPPPDAAAPPATAAAPPPALSPTLNVKYNAPDKIALGAATDFRLIIESAHPAGPNDFKYTPGPVEGHPITRVSHAKAMMTGPTDFVSISPESAACQTVSANDNPTWDWSVTPKTMQPFDLHVEIWDVGPDCNTPAPAVYRIDNFSITVTASWWQTLFDWIAKLDPGLKTLFGLIGAAGGAFAAWKWLLPALRGKSD